MPANIVFDEIEELFLSGLKSFFLNSKYLFIEEENLDLHNFVDQIEFLLS